MPGLLRGGSFGAPPGRFGSEVRPVPSICDCFAAKGCCAACLRHYFTTAVQDALYAMPIAGALGLQRSPKLMEMRPKQAAKGQKEARRVASPASGQLFEPRLTEIRCPLCRSRVPTAIWASFVDDKVYQKYVGNAEALLAMRCPNCDNSSSLARCVPPRRLEEGPQQVSRAASKGLMWRWKSWRGRWNAA